jgi:hypothetical protein
MRSAAERAAQLAAERAAERQRAEAVSRSKRGLRVRGKRISNVWNG